AVAAAVALDAVAGARQVQRDVELALHAVGVPRRIELLGRDPRGALEERADRVHRRQAIAALVILAEDRGTKALGVGDGALGDELLLRVVELRVQFHQRVPRRGDAHETHVRRRALRPRVDDRLEVAAVRAAVPEHLGYLDLVRAADRRLRGHQALEMHAFAETPLALRLADVRPRALDGLVPR